MVNKFNLLRPENFLSLSLWFNRNFISYLYHNNYPTIITASVTVVRGNKRRRKKIDTFTRRNNNKKKCDRGCYNLQQKGPQQVNLIHKE